MFLIILLLFIHLIELSAIIPYDGIIHRSTDGSSYAFLSPPETGDHASFIEEMTPSGTLAVAWFTGGEGQPNCSIAVSLLEVGSQQFTAGVIVSERVNYTNQNPVLYWDNETQILHLYHTSQLAQKPGGYPEIWHLQSKDRGKYALIQMYSFEKAILILQVQHGQLLNLSIPHLVHMIVVVLFLHSTKVDSSFHAIMFHRLLTLHLYSDHHHQPPNGLVSI
jgi:hypothetical protein